MKILFISHEDSKFGAPKSLMELILTLKKKFDVSPIVLLHSKDNVYNFCLENGIECYVTGHRNLVLKNGNGVALKLRNLLKRACYFVSRELALYRVKRQIDMKQIDIIHSNVSIVDLGLVLSKKYNVPAITHLREPASMFDEYMFCRKKYLNYINENSFRTISISQYNLNNWLKKGLTEERNILVYNGINTLNIPKRKSGVRKDKIKIIFSGSVSPEKGQIYLLKAISLLPTTLHSSISVDIVGSGERKYESYLQELAKDLNIDHIINFLGYKKNFISTLDNYDIGIIASKGEAFGRVTVEYMSAGLCVVASSSGANPEIIIDKQCGYLFQSGDYDLLANILIDLVNNSFKIDEIGKEASKRVNTYFTTEINAKEIFDVYLKILEESNGGNAEK
ncbi:glycosyltransferase family 4 protein [Enterococcus hulanensis]|uniref:Glycosyltransferase family 4 protein n=1 Tax=Enterococcus hulanensis TaxID=2559929 RepID=A0ABU3F5V8_9ENTE|nr:glycosyltransferase family 4 protein [Enterococcus hulanensis]MDT2602297.1 glycosyltransferase family 4 protein [Enterococcus hulanensis]MDT2611692.1 glycosyltransferase family 4 protein [Enterococcus hulanensis]MDT2618910.1 glycosyltransferase family 4 protein [Enterococcus hulanensis]MDT2630369.1 glycosyltransferase family 4 protein [Enterococcus hulanensis]MDT2657855.1 glycosyltransferase family 4 protein [Enterococcus hulanensis]